MLVPLGLVMGLMVAMTTKHLLADFLFQTAAIARGKAAERGWLLPLSIHAGIHAGMTLAVALAVLPAVWWIAPAEFVLHAGIDRAKVLIGRGAKLDMTKVGFWWLFGLDQFMHQITNIGIVYLFLIAAP